MSGEGRWRSRAHGLAQVPALGPRPLCPDVPVSSCWRLSEAKAASILPALSLALPSALFPGLGH